MTESFLSPEDQTIGGASRTNKDEDVNLQKFTGYGFVMPPA